MEGVALEELLGFLARAGLVDDEGTAVVGERTRGGELTALAVGFASGIVLTRADLARAARDIGLGGRVGDRLFILRSLFGQDADGTLAWLEGEARGWIAKHLARRGVSDGVAEFWAGRAEATAALLTALRLEAALPRQEHGGSAGD